MAIKSYRNMDDLLKMADEFASLIKEAKGKRGRKPKKMRNRKDVEKDLAFAKKRYSKSKADVSFVKDQIDKLQSQLENSTSDMNDARDAMVDSHKIMKGMDLSGASMVQGDGADVSYVIDKKRFDISYSDDGSFSLTPAGKKKEDKNQANDANLADDSLDLDSAEDSDDANDINWVKDFETIFQS